ncbi:MAG: prolipoprotein diacylglyceryl transferase [Bacteroidales bacterium]|nr:prolipoprotein diacylglyceryl transferase [Bacteroidales bacterium]
MYPKLSDLINDIFGTNINLPIQSYGFMVALAFLCGIWILYLELKRKQKEQFIPVFKTKVTTGLPASKMEIISSAIVGFILAWKGVEAIFDYSFFADNPQEFLFSLKGNISAGLVVGALSGFYTWYAKNKAKLSKPIESEREISMLQISSNILMLAAVFGLLGAKIFDTVEHLDDFMADPLGTLFSFSGLTFYGGLICGSAAALIYAYRKKIPMLVLLESAAPAIMLAYGVGRIGCQISGDGCWGIVNDHPKPEWLAFLPDWAWAFNFPHNVINEGVLIPDCCGSNCHVLDQPVYPTSLYESSLAFLFFIILWCIRKVVKPEGMLFGIFLMMNGITRFLIEGIRVNIKYDFLGMSLTQAQIIALCLFVAGIAFSIWTYYRWRKSHPKVSKK